MTTCRIRADFDAPLLSLPALDLPWLQLAFPNAIVPEKPAPQGVLQHCGLQKGRASLLLHLDRSSELLICTQLAKATARSVQAGPSDTDYLMSSRYARRLLDHPSVSVID